MLELLLGIIAVMLFLIYKKISKTVDADKPEGYNFKELIKGININLNDVIKNTSLIADYYESENPAGMKSNKHKRLNNLIKIYAQYLKDTEKLNEKDALIRAQFEVRIFGEEKVIDEIDENISNGIYWKERSKAEKEYYNSGLIEKDIKAYGNYYVKNVKKVMPFSLMARVYNVLVKDGYEKGKGLEIAWFREEDDYGEFIENRACIYQLEKLGVIKKINNSGWGQKPKWIMTTTDLSELKKIIYEGGVSHDNDYFEELYSKGELPRIFQVVELRDE